MADDYPIETKPIGFEWANPSRYLRIEDVLSVNSDVSLNDAMGQQNDDGNMVGQRLAAFSHALSASTRESVDDGDIDAILGRASEELSFGRADSGARIRRNSVGARFIGSASYPTSRRS